MAEKLPNNLYNILKNGEKTTVELKKKKKELPSSLFETICGMLNRNGGHIFLGVRDNKDIVGVDESKIDNIRKTFINLCNNPTKIYPTIYLEIKEFEIDNKHILYTYVYESSDVHNTAGKIYDRNGDGDLDITNNTSLVSQLYIRKSNTYIENKIYPYATINDLRPDLISKARIMATNSVANHKWSTMTDIEMLRSACLYERNLQTGEEGLNLAAILLFGKDETIASALSYYRTDAILKIDNIDRYDDRDDIRTNLLDSYQRLTDFIKKHLDDKFYIEGDQRINVRDVIARELCANLLIHREYSNPLPARLTITKEAITTENANKPRTIGYIDLNNYSPYPKNPKIAGVFKEIGLADELGSGIKTITKYNKIYSNCVPSFKDDEIFKVTIPMTRDFVEKSILSNQELCDILFQFISTNNGVSRKEINQKIYPLLEDLDDSQKDNKVKSLIRTLRDSKHIQNQGKNKSSIWISIK